MSWALAVIVSALLFCSLPSMAFAQEKDSTGTGTGAVDVSQDATSAKSQDTSFAITGFLRSNTGTSKTYNGAYYGHRFPLSAAGSFAIVVTDNIIMVYIPADSARELSIDINNPRDQEAFKQLVKPLDAQASMGNQPLQGLTTPYLFTSEESIAHSGFIYHFADEVEPGRYYASVTTPQGTSVSDASLPAVLYVDSGLLLPASKVTIDQAPKGALALWRFFGGIDYRPFWVSLRTSLVAMAFVFVLGLLAAYSSLRINQRVRAVFDSIFTIPMVLPPTVVGFLLLVLFGNSTGFGRWLIDHGVVLVFSWPGAVVAAVVVAFPLMYRTARGAFEGLDPDLGDAARTLGWSDSHVFFRLTLPLAWPSIAAGTVLAFARAMGEFGATLFVAGNFAGITQTMPIAIYFQWMAGRTDVATFWVVVVILISFLVILFINWYAARLQRYRKVGAHESES